MCFGAHVIFATYLNGQFKISITPTVMFVPNLYGQQIAGRWLNTHLFSKPLIANTSLQPDIS